MELLDKKTIELYANRLLIELEPFLSSTCSTKTLSSSIKSVLKDFKTDKIDVRLKQELSFSYKLLKTPQSKFAFVSLISACENKYEKELVEKVLYVLAISFYLALLNSYIPYCNEYFLDRALQYVKSSNIFKKYGIKNGLEYLAKNVADRYIQKHDCSTIATAKTIYELRHRIAQSLKSVTAAYYKLSRQKETLKDISIDQLVDKTIQRITIYGVLNIPKACSNISSDLNKLFDVDENLLEAVLTELFTKLGNNPSRQKIITNINKLLKLKILLKELGLEDNIRNAYCLIQTLYRTSQNQVEVING